MGPFRMVADETALFDGPCQPGGQTPLGIPRGPAVHRKMSAWPEVDIQADATQLTPIDVTVPREGIRLQISDRRRAQ